MDDLTDLFTQKSFPNLMAIVTAVLLYLAMLFPYILQDRHTNSTYRFWGMEKGYSNKNSGIDISMSQGEHSATTKPKENKVDDYESFTL